MKCSHVLLRDTSGSFILAIRLPSKDYKHRDTSSPDRRQYLREYYQNKKNQNQKGLKERKRTNNQFG